MLKWSVGASGDYIDNVMKESKLRNELSIVSENNINKAVPIVIGKF